MDKSTFFWLILALAAGVTIGPAGLVAVGGIWLLAVSLAKK